MKDVHKDYKKADSKDIKKINDSHKRVVKDLGIEDRVFKTSELEAFLKLKDHKPNFQNNPTCRLLNPCKPEV